MKASVTTLEAVESFAPERIVPIGQLADRLGLRRTELRLFERVHGLKEIRFDPDLDLFDVVLPAARRITANPLVRARLTYAVYAHTTQAVAPAHIDPAQEIKGRLGLSGAEAFALSRQNCASGIAAGDTVAELLRAEASGEPALVCRATGTAVVPPAAARRSATPTRILAGTSPSRV
ncbi:hypothetical protein DKT74_35850 [Streptomyces sp. ZEA17I]|nr:hypothetical protein DKT74_35850 [Streptomyces sp. ZEA17I]